MAAPRLFLVAILCIFGVNHVLIGLRAEMAVKPGFTK